MLACLRVGADRSASREVKIKNQSHILDIFLLPKIYDRMVLMDGKQQFDSHTIRKLFQTDIAKAEELILELLNQEPENLKYKLLWVELLLKKKAIEKAEKVCKEILAQWPTERYALQLKGRILLAKGNKKAAQEACEIFQYLFRQSPSQILLYWLLQAHLKAKQPQKAWQLLQNVPFHIQDNFYIRRLQAVILTKLKKYQDALKVYELLLKENPKDARLKRQVLLMKKYIKGNAKWESEIQTIASMPSAQQDVNLLLTQAQMARQHGKLFEAITLYEKVLKIEPQNKEAMLNLGFTLVKCKEAELIDRGIAILKQFFLQDPYFHPVRSALFSAYQRQGRVDALLSTLEETLQRHPEKVKIYGWIKRYEKLVETHATDS